MCGIFALISCKAISDNKYKHYTLRNAKKLVHRGPDGTGYYQSTYMSMAHTRLAIIDTEGGNQPLLSNDGTLSLCVNGEIFNYKELRAEFSTYQYNTKSDCESILGLYDYYRYLLLVIILLLDRG